MIDKKHIYFYRIFLILTPLGFAIRLFSLSLHEICGTQGARNAWCMFHMSPCTYTWTELLNDRLYLPTREPLETPYKVPWAYSNRFTYEYFIAIEFFRYSLKHYRLQVGTPNHLDTLQKTHLAQVSYPCQHLLLAVIGFFLLVNQVHILVYNSCWKIKYTGIACAVCFLIRFIFLRP